MTSPSLQTLIGTGALALSAAVYAGPATSIPDFSGVTQVAGVSPLNVPPSSANEHSSVIPWATMRSDTAVLPEWMTQDHASHNKMITALVSSGVDPNFGLALIERAKAILHRDNVSVVGVDVSTVLDPEDDYQIAQIAFLIDTDFKEAVRVDLALTRELIKETRIPIHLSLIVQEASSIQHDFV